MFATIPFAEVKMQMQFPCFEIRAKNSTTWLDIDPKD